MSRGDIMTGRRRSLRGYILFAGIVFGLIYFGHSWLSRQPATPPPASIPAVGDAVQRAYNTLKGAFRDKVPLAEFAGMYHRMADPNTGGDLPEVRLASVTDPTGPEHPVARFRVEYPGGKSRAEYSFSRIEGIWQLQAFTRAPSEMPFPDGEVKAGSPGVAPAPKGARKVSATGEGAASQVPGGADGRPATPCDYVVQPGDTLTAVSLHFYGTPRYWRRIMEANPGVSASKLRVGRRIRIPSNPDAVATPKEEPSAEPKAPTPTP